MARDGGYLAGEGGWLVLFGLFGAAIAAVFGLAWLSLVGLLLTVAALVLFRDPPREIPSAPLAVVSPVDGMVTAVRPATGNGEGETGQVIEIRIHRLGAWSIRAPVEGKVMGLRGLESGPERGLWLCTDEDDDVVTELAGPSRPYWVRPVAVVKTGERLGQGQRFGYRRLARTARIHIHGRANVSVTEGQRVLAGSDLLATLIHD